MFSKIQDDVGTYKRIHIIVYEEQLLWLHLIELPLRFTVYTNRFFKISLKDRLFNTILMQTFFSSFFGNFWNGLNVDNDAWLLVDM